MMEALRYKVSPGETIMVKHGALSKSHVYKLLRSKDARVRRAAFTLLETSNPRLRRNSELFIEITRFIWDANPSYDVYQEFTKRHFQARYKVHELIGARLNIEKQNQQSAAAQELARNARRCEGGFFQRLFLRPSRS
jgi:Zn-dependent oligopeptidase